MIAKDQAIRFGPGDMLLRGGKVYYMVRGNAGSAVFEAGKELVGASDLVKRFKLAAPIIVTRWVKAGLPHTVIAGRRVFNLGQVKAWLAGKGYSLGKLRAGAGLVAAHRRRGEQRWQKGQMSPVAEESRRKRENRVRSKKREKRP